MKWRVFQKLPHPCGLATGAFLLLASCDSPEQEALKALEAVGIEPNGSAMIDAVHAGDSTTLALLVAAGVPTEVRDQTGRTPLRIAAENGDLASVALLLEAGADFHARSLDGQCSLGIATRNGHRETAESLVAAGARTEAGDPSGRSILSLAIRQDWRDLATALVMADADPNLPDDEGFTGFSWIVRNGWTEHIAEWVVAGAEVNLPDGQGFTPLQLAATQQDLELLEALLRSGADPDQSGGGGETACDVAFRAKWREGMQALAEAGADWNVFTSGGESLLDMALGEGDRETVAFLLRFGARPANGNWSRWLQDCVAREDVATARLLLQHGASVAARSEAMESAAAAGSGTFCKLFLDFGLPPGRALEIACRRNDWLNARLLLEHGVSPNHGRAPFLGTPLAAAIRNRNDALAVLLLDKGANPNVRVSEGQLPLHLAVAKGCSRTVTRMVAAGADVDARLIHPVRPEFLVHIREGILRWVLKNDENITPLMIAADAGDIATVRALLGAGASQSVWTRKHKIWPINFASRRSDIQMMRVLLGQDPENEERHLVISLSEQQARLYDAAGKVIFSSRVSTGKKGFETPTGEFVITNKYRDWKSTLYDAKMPHFQRFSCGDFGIHAGAVPGYPASHGCIRVPAANAARLFSMTRTGDRVKIVP